MSIDWLCSRHVVETTRRYRVVYKGGNTAILDEATISGIRGGRRAMDLYDIRWSHECRRPPTVVEDGPSVGDLIGVKIDGLLNVCKVEHVVSSTPPTYRVLYDDGMLVEDRLCLPWTFFDTIVAQRTIPPILIRVTLQSATAPPTATAPTTSPAASPTATTPTTTPAAPPTATAPTTTSAAPTSSGNFVTREMDTYHAERAAYVRMSQLF